jgi:lipopolysaccharide assembly outer membrane protein LptD (OstA)
MLVMGLAYAKSEPIELLRAGTMQKVTETNENTSDDDRSTYLMFDKDVHLKQGNVHLYAQRVYQYEKIDLLKLMGEVRIFDDSVDVYFEQGEYNTETKDLNVPTKLSIYYDGREFNANTLKGNLDSDVYLARGDVEIKDSSSYAYADSLKFDRENDRAWLFGEAMMSDTVNHITMRGAELEYRLDSDEFFGNKDASVYETLEDGKKRFEVFAKKLWGNMNDAWLIATDSVYVQQDSSAGWCDSLFYNDSLQIVGFYGNAHLRYQDIDMYGPEMHLNFHREHLGTLITPKDPRVTLKEDGFIGEDKEEAIEKISQMTGKHLRLEFNEKDEPDWLDMSGMVTSDYHVFKDSVYKGMNHMTSDTVHIVFDEGDVSDLFAIFGVEGRFDPDTSYAEMDTSVIYHGNQAHYSITNDNMYIYPSTDMTYGEIKLKADTMKIDWKTNILYAMPGKSGDLPEFIQGNDDPVYGRLFEYNLDTQRGRITRGKTSIKEGYYQGQTVLKTEDEPLYVEHGIFSTCELEHPHFCIEAKQMKVIPGDRVFAQDLTLKVMDIPLLYIPSLFVSIEEGKRRSGWVIPGFKQSVSYGWGLTDAGYYWAPNDYYDARLLVDFYDNLGIKLKFRQRYALKDHINGGSVTFSYWNNFLASKPKQGFKIEMNHPQKIGRKSSLNIQGNYTNDRTRYEDELDLDQRLEQQMLSKASFQTSLGPFSVNINASHNEDLQTGTSTTFLPQFSISKKSASIIKKKNKSLPDKWYHKFTYSISSSMSNKLTHTYDGVDTNYVVDPTDPSLIDTLVTDMFIDEQKNKLQTTAGVRYNDKLFGFLTVTPYLNYYEDWTTLYKAPVIQNDSALVDTNGNLILQDIEGFKRRGRFNLGTTLSTTLYGVFNLNIGALKAVRHTMTMSMSYVYRPDLSYDPRYVFKGYGTDGEEVKYDYFASTLLGATPSAESKTFGMSFNHNFDMKTTNKEGKEKKVTFLNLKHSINFLADSLQSSLFNATSTIKDLPGGMALKINATFDPYDVRINDDGSYTRINQLAVPRMTYLRMSTGFDIKEKDLKKNENNNEVPDTSKVDELNAQTLKSVKGSDTGFSNWSLSTDIVFESQASNPLNIKNKLLITASMKANLTPKWSGSYKIYFDVLEQKITDQRLSLVRDLHCWKLALDWRPGKSIFIGLNAKASLLDKFKLLQKDVRFR